MNITVDLSDVSEGRRLLDVYDTPEALAHAICAGVRKLYPLSGSDPRRILDPACGGGVFIRAAKATWPEAQVIGVDVRADCEEAALAAGGSFVHHDFLGLAGPLDPAPDLIIGNPPYLAAEAFVAQAQKLAPNALTVLLLPLGFLASQTRWLNSTHQRLLNLHPVVPRPSFTGDGKTDSTEYGVFVYAAGINNVFTAVAWEKPAARVKEKKEKKPRKPRKPKTEVAASAPAAPAITPTDLD